jgi:hypothetical protein
MGASSNNGWRRCPEGEFSKLAGRLTARRKQRLAFGVLVGVGVGVLVSAVGAAVTEFIYDSIIVSSGSGCCPSQHPPVGACDPPEQTEAKP